MKNIEVNIPNICESIFTYTGTYSISQGIRLFKDRLHFNPNTMLFFHLFFPIQKFWYASILAINISKIKKYLHAGSSAPRVLLFENDLRRLGCGEVEARELVIDTCLCKSGTYCKSSTSLLSKTEGGLFLYWNMNSVDWQWYRKATSASKIISESSTSPTSCSITKSKKQKIYHGKAKI